jgi:hypothetical protein
VNDFILITVKVATDGALGKYISNRFQFLTIAVFDTRRHIVAFKLQDRSFLAVMVGSRPV